MSQTQKIPVVYVRGFAGGQSGIDSAVTDPFLGFNAGSTHVRIGPDDKPSFYQFESPLLRLMVDEGYQLLVHGNQDTYLDAHPEIPAASIWIHRFYDPSASTWGGVPKEFRLEDAAKDLLELIEKLRAKAHVDRVHLIAHSMGGLICRCLIQKILPERGIEPTAYVDKLFTYGTPHGGIAFDLGFGLLERLRDAIGINGAEVFGRERMYQYLTPGATAADEPPDHWDPRAMPADEEPFAFPHQQVFCLIGTDPGDYDVAHGLSSAAVGPRSDGLVQIDKAYVPGAHCAYVHRSHSGRYGLVNSEEGYQNLRRFLFGGLKVESALVHVRLPEEKNTAWQAEVRLSIRGLPIVMHERTSAQWCPIQLGGDAQPGADGDGTVPLVSTFLCENLASPNGASSLRYALHLRVLSLRERDNGFLDFQDHIEQTADFDDILVVDVSSDARVPVLRAVWNSTIDGPVSDYTPEGPNLADEDAASGSWVSHIPLPGSTRSLLGEDARIRLSATDWR
ncbi:alpha/beta hydrolase [Streptomyces sp. JHA26]|uniref:alpha/beta hydrolase n=1 Tax=Streptomyces sp. JHA26 TaxID=1917143 RepID=UPI00098B85A9|nr:alpha/beta hydrolase [Streptomyces sp. JHA26]